jgi:hypothetical protein
VRDILHNRSLVEPEHGEPHPLDDGNLEYLMFGGGNEYFLSHRITFHQTPANNAFHQLFGLDDATAAALRFDLPTLAATVRLAGPAATAEGRLPAAGGSFAGRVTGLVDHSDTALDVELGTGEELYLEMLM